MDDVPNRGGVVVSVETGLRFAEKLQSVLDGREWGTDVLELKVQLGQIIDVVHSVVPQSMWAAIVEQLEQLEQHPEALDVGEDGFDDADDAFDPMEFAEEDGFDDFDLRRQPRQTRTARPQREVNGRTPARVLWVFACGPRSGADSAARRVFEDLRSISVPGQSGHDCSDRCGRLSLPGCSDKAKDRHAIV